MISILDIKAEAVLQSFSRVVFALSTLCDVTAPMAFATLPEVQAYLSEHGDSLASSVASCCPDEVRNVVVASLDTVKSLETDDYAGLTIATGLIQFHISSSIGEK